MTAYIIHIKLNLPHHQISVKTKYSNCETQCPQPYGCPYIAYTHIIINEGVRIGGCGTIVEDIVQFKKMVGKKVVGRADLNQELKILYNLQKNNKTN